MNPGLILAHQANYADFFDRFSSAILLIDPETCAILEANFEAEKLFSLDLTTLKTQTLTTIFNDINRPQFEKLVRKANRQYQSYALEEVLVNIGSRPLWSKIEAASLELAEGRKVIQVIIFDINEKKKLALENERLSTTDGLTGLKNRRYFDESLTTELSRAARDNQPCSLILLDVDNFKHYNDRNGHPAGDTLLKELGTLLNQQLRTIDIACRYGGEEFAIICPNTSALGAGELSERLRVAIANYPFAHREHQPLGTVSVSMGIGTFPEHGLQSQELKEATDRALYVSKRSGRNRATSADRAAA